MYGDAVISSCGLYRYSLWRSLPVGTRTSTLFDASCLFVMNNPSTADAIEDDPTIRRVKAFAGAWGFGRVYVANCNPSRATDPRKAKRPPADVLDRNDAYLSTLAGEAAWTVAAWGSKADPYLVDRAVRVLTRVTPLKALGLTKDGQPKHPLYLRADLRPFGWRLDDNSCGRCGATPGRCTCLKPADND